MKCASWLCSLNLLIAGCAGTQARDESGTESAAEVYAPPPPSVLTPGRVETRLGTLEFFDGLPTEQTVQKLYDQLDFARGVRAFLETIPGASMMAMRKGMEEVGALPNYTVLVTGSLMDARSLFLTPNSETVYAFAWLSLKGGPMVVESPPNVLGVMNDAWQRHITDLGNAGPDQGKGGKFIVLPPGNEYQGEVPKGYYLARSPTYGVWVVFRGFLENGQTQTAYRNFTKHIRLYPLKEARRPPKTQFLNISGKPFNTVHANDFSFFEEVDSLVQEEPGASQDPEILGLLASIGIEKGKPFAPDARMKAILTEAAAVGNATARAQVFATRDEAAYLYPGSQWQTGFIGGSHEFLRDGARLQDARTRFYYSATVNTPAMVTKNVGAGSQYAIALRDSRGRPLDGRKTYSMTLPADAPVADFWSVVVYDNQTRSMLQTDQAFPSLSSERGKLQKNPDGSVTLYFGPKPPAKNKKNNWIQTIPGKGWNVILRLYGPLEPWFDKTWRPGELEPMQNIAAVEPGGKRPKMATDIPSSILTPDKTDTRIGTLEFVDGFPTDETVERVYDNLDFIRGVEGFLSTISGASLMAMRRGLRQAGVTDNRTVGIFDRFMDSHSLFLTGNTQSVYAATWLDLSQGAMVVQSPANTLGIVDDFFFRYLADLGHAGPDEDKGGLFLFAPPDYDGQVSDRYFNYRSPTYGNLALWQGVPVDGDPGPAEKNLRKELRIYPFDIPDLELEAQQTPSVTESIDTSASMRFVRLSGKSFNTIHSNDFTFFEEIHQLIQEEPAEAFSPEIVGLLASVGIERGKPFTPDPRMKAILTEAAVVANATARADAFRHRDPAAFLYEDSAWYTPFVGGSYEFLRNGARLLDARTMFFYLATMSSPAMASQQEGAGSQYGLAATDSKGRYLDGAKTYRLRLPPSVPAKDFWSVVVYDPQTRSMLQTPQTARPSLSSKGDGVRRNEDGSTELFFGPEAPEGRSANWIQTVPGKAWFLILRLYRPLKPWFDKTWRPGEIELVE